MTRFHDGPQGAPGFLTYDLHQLSAHLQANEVRTIDDHDHPDYRRFFTTDPWGNRLEFVQRREKGTSKSPRLEGQASDFFEPSSLRV